MVEIINNGQPWQYDGDTTPGKVGTIVQYIGMYQTYDKRYVPNAWEVNLADGTPVAVNEPSLKLIPGNQDCKDIGNWDQCPWSPYRDKVTYDF